MFKIGEFSRLGQVSTRMLRHYDQLGLLKPSQTDKFTSYRYYTIDQLARLNRIIALKELGFSLEQVAQLLDREGELSPEKLRGMLTMRRAEIERELQDKHMQLAEVEARLRQIEQEGQPSPYEIVIKSVSAQPVASIRQIVPRMSEMGYYCRTMYAELYAALARNGITPLQPEITLYHTDLKSPSWWTTAGSRRPLARRPRRTRSPSGKRWSGTGSPQLASIKISRAISAPSTSSPSGVFNRTGPLNGARPNRVMAAPGINRCSAR
jgi:DNA-binding transcriptional MerR regulator